MSIYSIINNDVSYTTIDNFKKVVSCEVQKSLDIANEIADLICFHSQCRENYEKQLISWDN